MTVKNRGQEGTRTLDQLIKSQLLYQLSYLPDIAHWKYNFFKKQEKDFCFCCAARGHALAVCNLLAPLRSTSSSKRAPPARNKPAPRATYFSTLTNQNVNPLSHHENAALADLYWPKQGV